MEARGPFRATLDQAERFYTSLASPTVFRLSPLAGPEPDRILADRGYGVLDETIVMTKALGDIAPADSDVTITGNCLDAWENGYADAHHLPANKRRAHRAILDRISPLPRAFASVWDDNGAIAFGLGVLERDHLGIFDIVTVPQARRRGAARKLVSALMHWGSAREAKTAWLSVIGDNEKAKPLYADLGFRELYRYHYRVSDQQDA